MSHHHTVAQAALARELQTLKVKLSEWESNFRKANQRAANRDDIRRLGLRMCQSVCVVRACAHT